MISLHLVHNERTLPVLEFVLSTLGLNYSHRYETTVSKLTPRTRITVHIRQTGTRETLCGKTFALPISDATGYTPCGVCKRRLKTIEKKQTALVPLLLQNDTK